MIEEKPKNQRNISDTFDYPTTITPDVKEGGNGNMTLKEEYSENLHKLMNKHNLSKDSSLLAIFLFNLVKFSFSKDILISYNSSIAGYHFNTDLSVTEYINDFKKEYVKFNDKKNTENEILFTSQEYSKEEYKLIFSYDDDSIIVDYDSSSYSNELISTFMKSFNILIDRFDDENELLKDISIVEVIDSDEDFEVQLANEGLINKIFENMVNDNPDKSILYADEGIEYNPIVEIDSQDNEYGFDNISMLNNIADKVDYTRVLGLNSTIITVIKDN